MKKILTMFGAALCVALSMTALADLPSGYRQLEYVDTDGSTWVNTLYRPTCTNAVEIKAAINETTGWNCLYCTRRAGTNRSYTFFINATTRLTRFDYKTKYSAGNSELNFGVPYVFAASPSEDEGQEEVGEKDKAWTLTCTQDGELAATVSDHYFTVDGAAYFCLFGSYQSPGGDVYSSAVLNDETTVANRARCRFYYFKVWDTKDRDNLRCHIVPVYGEAEHAVGLYDLVAGRFLPAHGGVFVVPISSNIELSANEDWSSAPVMIADGVTVDLGGHDLTVASVGTNAVSVLNPCYQDLAYVTANGSQYVRITDFKIPGTAKVEMKVRPTKMSGSQFLFCSRSGGTSKTYSLLLLESGYLRFDFNNKQTTGTKASLSVENDSLIVLDGSTETPTWTVDGVSEKIHDAQSNDFTSGTDLYLFSTQTGTGYPASCRLYYFTVSTNGVTILDLHPVRRISDGAVGLYDSVGNAFYASGTATALSAPIDVPKFSNTSETVSELCVGREWVPGYMVVDSITSSGAQHIDTGFVPASTDRVEIKASLSATGGNYGLFCSRDADAKNSMTAIFSNSNTARFDLNENQKTTSIALTASTQYTIALDGNEMKCYVDGEQVWDFSYAGNDFTPSANLFLFALHKNGSGIGYRPSGSIYWFKVTGADGTLKLDMVPAVRNQDNVAGLYDRVRHKFYPSASETAFTAGTQVGDGKLYVDEDGAFAGSEIAGNITLVKKGEKAFDGGGMSITSTLKPEAGTVGGVVLQDGATLDLSALSEKFNLDDNAVSFADGASITIDLGSRKVSSRTPLVSWTTAPENVGALTFLDGKTGKRLTVNDDGIYPPPKGLVILFR